MNKKIIVYLLFIGFMFIGSFVGIILYYNTSVNVLKEQTNEYFGSIAQSRAHHIDTFLSEDKNKIKIIAQRDSISNSLENLENLEELDEELKEILEISEAGIYEVFVLDKNGKIIASTDESNIGLDKSNDDYFVNGKEEAYIKDAYYSETTGINSIAYSSPVFDDETKRFMGVVVMRTDLIGINEITEDKTGLGKTGEIYLINLEGYAITHLLFEEDSFLKQKVESVNAIECLNDLELGIEEGEDIKEELFIFENYRGAMVLGVDVPIHETQWCLLAEINERESIGLLKTELITSGLLVLIGISVFIGVFILILNKFLLGGKKI